MRECLVVLSVCLCSIWCLGIDVVPPVSPQTSHEGITSVLSSIRMPSLSFESEDSRRSRSGGRDYFVKKLAPQTTFQHFLAQPVIETTASKIKSPPMKADLFMDDDSPHPIKRRRSNDEVLDAAAMEEDSPLPTQVVDLPRMILRNSADRRGMWITMMGIRVDIHIMRVSRARDIMVDGTAHPNHKVAPRVCFFCLEFVLRNLLFFVLQDKTVCSQYPPPGSYVSRKFVKDIGLSPQHRVLTGKILDYEWDGECEKKIGEGHDVMIGEFEGEASVLFELAPRDKTDKPNRMTSENIVCLDVFLCDVSRWSVYLSVGYIFPGCSSSDVRGGLIQPDRCGETVPEETADRPKESRRKESER